VVWRNRRDDDQAEIAPGEHGESGIWVHLFVEAQVLAVEGDRGVGTVDDSADADCARRTFPPNAAFQAGAFWLP
jgi:hypothetical protein